MQNATTPAPSTASHRYRIPPGSPRAIHVMGGTSYERGEGWRPCSATEGIELSKVALYDTSPNSEPLFQVVTAAEAHALDRAESAAARRKGTARNPIDPATGLPADDDELEAMRAQLVESKAAADAATATAAAHAANFGALLAHVAKMGGPLPPELAGLVPPPPPPPPPVPSSEGDADAKPQRPGGKAPSGLTKAQRRAQADMHAREHQKPVAVPQGVAGTQDDPLGSKAAAEGIDEGLRSQGFTVDRPGR